MTIEQLDERKVLISLGCDDMKNFDLEFENMSFYSEHSKRVLLRLLRLACMKAGLSHMGVPDTCDRDGGETP